MVNPSTAQARVVVDELIRGGVRDVVLCPGSRNAPLAFALQDADRAGRLRLHVRIDERTAGYLAIGLAVAERAPVCVAMTSGTAVANLGPAVVEANYARVPLIVLSANRPYELLGTGANQTMEQLGYFGTQVRASISLGLAEEAPERLDALNAQWRSATCRVLVAATPTTWMRRRRSPKKKYAPTADIAANCDPRTDVIPIESWAPHAKDAIPTTSATPALTTNGVARRAMRSVPRIASGRVITTTPRSRAGIRSHANATSPLTCPTE